MKYTVAMPMSPQVREIVFPHQHTVVVNTARAPDAKIVLLKFKEGGFGIDELFPITSEAQRSCHPD